MRAAIRSGIRLTVAQLPRRPALNVRLDTNASGDFVLMSRQDWVGLRGYPEFQTFSMHLDSLLLYQAYYSGMREIILPYPVYHMTHTAGWGLGAEQSSLVGRLDVFGVPYLSYARFLQIVEKLSKTKDKHFNGLNWGLVDQQLPESGPSPKEISTLARSESTGNARA